MSSAEIEMEKRLAILAACIMLLGLRRRAPGPRAAARGTWLSGWALAARLDSPPEDWSTVKWGEHEEEV